MKTTIRKLALILVFITGILSAPAIGQIAVSSFRPLPNDLDAQAHYPKFDKDGEKAALIKIVTPEKGFEFDGGSIGIVATVEKTGEIWLYVPRGSKILTISHARLGVLRQYNYPERIEGGSVYEMKLVSGTVVTTVVPPTVESQWLIISTTPEGADVFINDQPAGKTPYQNELPTGKYNYRVWKELYLPEGGKVELVSGSEKKKIELMLKPDFGRVNITSTEEPGAIVSIDGKRHSKVTPCTIDTVPSGEHTIILTHDLYQTTTQKFTLAAGETKELAISMKPMFAEVTVNTDPKADIYVNEVKKGNDTWTGRLFPGVYTFEARLDKHKPDIQKQAVAIGQPLSLSLTPTPRTGNLKVVTTPFEASIKINGTEKGTSPVTFSNLLIGTYEIEISKEGFATVNKNVVVKEGQTEELNLRMTSSAQVKISCPAPDAQLIIDGRNLGKMPWSGTLPMGSHPLRIVCENHETLETTLELDGSKSQFTFNLTRRTFNLTIKSVPSGANLSVDNMFRGTTPSELTLGKGSHRIDLAKDGYNSFGSDIFVDGSSDIYEFELTKIRKEKKARRGPEDFPKTILGIGFQRYLPVIQAIYEDWYGGYSFEVDYEKSYGGCFWMRFMSKSQRWGTEFSFAITNLNNPSPDSFTFPDDQSAVVAPMFIFEDWYFSRRSNRVYAFLGAGLGYVYWKQYSYDATADQEYNLLAFSVRGGLGVRLSDKVALEFSYSTTVGSTINYGSLNYNMWQIGMPFSF